MPERTMEARMPGDTKYDRWLWRIRAGIAALVFLVLMVLWLTGNLREATRIVH